MARKISAIHKEKMQNGHHRIITGSRNSWTDEETEIQEVFIWGIGMNIERPSPLKFIFHIIIKTTSAQPKQSKIR